AAGAAAGHVEVLVAVVVEVRAEGDAVGRGQPGLGQQPDAQVTQVRVADAHLDVEVRDGGESRVGDVDQQGGRQSRDRGLGGLGDGGGVVVGESRADAAGERGSADLLDRADELVPGDGQLAAVHAAAAGP